MTEWQYLTQVKNSFIKINAIKYDLANAQGNYQLVSGTIHKLFWLLPENQYWSPCTKIFHAVYAILSAIWSTVTALIMQAPLVLAMFAVIKFDINILLDWSFKFFNNFWLVPLFSSEGTFFYMFALSLWLLIGGYICLCIGFENDRPFFKPLSVLTAICGVILLVASIICLFRSACEDVSGGMLILAILFAIFIFIFYLIVGILQWGIIGLVAFAFHIPALLLVSLGVYLAIKIIVNRYEKFTELMEDFGKKTPLYSLFDNMDMAITRRKRKKYQKKFEKKHSNVRQQIPQLEIERTKFLQQVNNYTKAIQTEMNIICTSPCPPPAYKSSAGVNTLMNYMRKYNCNIQRAIDLIREDEYRKQILDQIAQMKKAAEEENQKLQEIMEEARRLTAEAEKLRATVQDASDKNLQAIRDAQERATSDASAIYRNINYINDQLRYLRNSI